MENFPVSLDTLITFVEAIQPEGDSLSHLSDAVRVSGRVEEKADALIGYFVDEARRSGASWSQIGQSMGVSKQAVQKRFVAQASDGERLANRMPPRSRAALTMSRRLAAADEQASQVEARHLVGGLMSEPDGVAATAVRGLGVDVEAIFDTLALPPIPGPGSDQEFAQFGDGAKQVIAHALDIALHYGHNYIGTEHLLLSVASDSPASNALAELGLDATALRGEVEKILAKVQAEKAAD